MIGARPPEKTAVITQPTYLPWLGYFAAAREATDLVMLDSVQFDRRSWQQRNRVKSSNGPVLLTVPVLSKGRFDQLIKDVEIDQSQNMAIRHLRTLRHAYGKAPFFKRYIEEIEGILSKNHTRLGDLTIELITHFVDILGLECRLSRSSELGCKGKKEDLLADICETIGAHRYVSPVGASVYLRDTDVFKKKNIEVLYNTFVPQPYPQLHGEFVSLLSIVDGLFNIGASGCRELLDKGRSLTPAAKYLESLAG